jgi:hypothetical protein
MNSASHRQPTGLRHCQEMNSGATFIEPLIAAVARLNQELPSAPGAP